MLCNSLYANLEVVHYCLSYSYGDQVPSCTGRCGLGNCNACYHSRIPLSQPDFFGFCQSCSSTLRASHLQQCLRTWARCIHRMAKVFYGQVGHIASAFDYPVCMLGEVDRYPLSQEPIFIRIIIISYTPCLLHSLGSPA